MQCAAQKPKWARLWVPPLCAALALTVPAIWMQRANARHEDASAIQQRAIYTQQQLDQMLAPIALYPDSLLSQILMAATYPLEVVEAARWSRANPHLRGRQAVDAVEHMRWDPSVKSLVAFPRILAMMNERLQWTRDLGDGFLEQEPHVMETIQELRRRALAAGNLRTGQEVRVVARDRAILIEPANVEVAYVPYYDPVVVYGDWWWPAYPPMRWAPWPGYVVGPSYASAFYWGPAITVGTVFFFGAFDWHRRHAVIHHHHDVFVARTRFVESDARWIHDPTHRRGVNYRSDWVRQRVVREQAAVREDQRLSTPRFRADRALPRPSRQAPLSRAIERDPSQRMDGRHAEQIPSQTESKPAPETVAARRAARQSRAETNEQADSIGRAALQSRAGDGAAESVDARRAARQARTEANSADESADGRRSKRQAPVQSQAAAESVQREHAARSSESVTPPRTPARPGDAAASIGNSARNQSALQWNDRAQRGRELRDRGAERTARSDSPSPQRNEREARPPADRSLDAEAHPGRGRAVRDRSEDISRREVRSRDNPSVHAAPTPRPEARMSPPLTAPMTREPAQTRSRADASTQRAGSNPSNAAPGQGREHGRGAARSEKRERGNS